MPLATCTANPHLLEAPVGECPSLLALDLIANKWSIQLLAHLLQAPQHTQRFNQLKKSLGRITQRELTKQLRAFESAGIVLRVVTPTVPLRVDYTLTPLGHSLWQPVENLSAWALKHGHAVQANRRAFTATNPIELTALAK